ncbi:hypothetical protein [Govanella unica]|uniref:Uncharacterized protein n=1 Tax=Govanella unica TaxID=2975056 RepID=A0A9X3Z6B2_9PROT|nr:hypothetical protein [Govania unica]MDA5193035.1 hypothetical protein [Govania unica]
MYFTVLHHNETECELKPFELPIGRIFYQECENYETRVELRQQLLLTLVTSWQRKYGEQKVRELFSAFSCVHFFFEAEEDLPYIASILEYDSLRPSEIRIKREQRIAEIFQKFLGVPSAYEAYLNIAKCCAFLIPDHLIAGEVSAVCAVIAKASPEEKKFRMGLYLPIFDAWKGANKNTWFLEFMEAQRFYPHAELEAAAAAWIVLADQGIPGQEKQAFLKSCLVGREKSYVHGSCHAFLMFKAEGMSLKDLKERARSTYAQLHLHNEDLARTSLIVFNQALNCGFDFGPQGERNRAMIQNLEQRVSEKLEKLRPQIADRRAAAIKPVEKASGKGEIEEALWAWPVDKLVDYIGPLGRKGHGRKKQKKQPEKKPVPQTSGAAETGSREEDSLIIPEYDQAVVELGLRNSLAFYERELSAGLSMAKKLKLPPEMVARLKACCEAMSLFSKVKKLVIAEVKDSLEQASDLFDELRSEITKRKQTAELLQKFDDALMAACANEDAVYGKRYGGEIGYPLDLEHWGLISKKYHNCLIRGRNKIRISGQECFLKSNEVLVFYVTFSSCSGYAFDICAHLWRRSEDEGDKPPTLSSEAGPQPMDVENWHDTLIPCFVLHVPNRH